jgi:allantoinase
MSANTPESLPDLALHSTRVLTEDGLKDLTLVFRNGRIEELKPGSCPSPDFPFEDAGNLLVMPGLIDSHVHVNEPGRTEWEGFETITKAAVAGGITTIVDMPLNSSPVTTTAATFQEKIKATAGKLYCNSGFWGGIVPANADHLEELIQTGVLGIKAFLTHSGIDDFPNVSEADLRKGMPMISNYRIPLLVHAELEESPPGIAEFEKNPSSYMAYLGSRPRSWEDKAVAMMTRLCEEFNCRVHIVHLSSSGSLALLKKTKARGLPLTVETCPQYLYFCAEEIPDGNTLYKCAPPIREKENNEQLWKALKEGIIDFVVTDHSPSTPELKQIKSGNLREAWGGISSLQFSLPVMWTAARKHGFSLREVSALMSTHVASFIGFEHSKGLIKKGFDADVVVWDPGQQFKVEESNTHFRHKQSPYMGESLYGLVRQTYVGGRKVYEDGKIIGEPQGKILLRQERKNIF